MWLLSNRMGNSISHLLRARHSVLEAVEEALDQHLKMILKHNRD